MPGTEEVPSINDIHWRRQTWSIWLACGKRPAIYEWSHDPNFVTCRACLTHIKKVDSPL